ncbi:hypothetical protein [Desulfospira joergensenii]|uniref:hypothetical protein n=1 Tax=Desulfospira joergensenii TaxID=53329 RepID=UPI001294744D|nr:hypothetical protein [Desulfospira joergensenii]
MRILIIRHCETKKNIDNKFDSMDSNDTLTGEGKKQLSHLCTFLDKYWRSGSVIYTKGC